MIALNFFLSLFGMLTDFDVSILNWFLANFELLVDEDGSPAKKAAWLNDQPSAQDDTIKSFFDGQGNFQIGIPDFYLFREIEQNIEFTKLNGLNVSIVTSARTDYEARLLLSGFQAPWC